MYYFLDCNYWYDYRFVFDDTDNSVELVSVDSIKGLSIEQLKKKDLEDEFKKLSIAKLRILGFEPLFAYFIRKILCIYELGIATTLSLTYNMHGGCSVDIGVDLIGWFDKTQFLQEYHYLFTVSYKTVSIRIPYRMLLWILNLYAIHDFDGIMRSLNGFLGSNIYLIAGTSFNGVPVRFLEWL